MEWDGLENVLSENAAQLVIRAIYSFISCIYSHWLSPPLSPISQVRLICRSRISLVEFLSAHPLTFAFSRETVSADRKWKMAKKKKMASKKKRWLTKKWSGTLPFHWAPFIQTKLLSPWPSSVAILGNGVLLTEPKQAEFAWEICNRGEPFKLLPRFQLQLQIFICW